MTPDIARDDINPQGLRALPDDLDPRTYLRQVRTFLGRYADAWEKSIKYQLDDKIVMRNEIDVLRKRLETMTVCRDHWKCSYEDARQRTEGMKKAMLNAKANLGIPQPDTSGPIATAWRLLEAALAGEERP